MSNQNLIIFLFSSLDEEWYKLSKATNDNDKQKIMHHIVFIQQCMSYRTPPSKDNNNYFAGNNKYFLDQMNKTLLIGREYVADLSKKTIKDDFIIEMILNRMNFIRKCIFIMTHPNQEYIHKYIDSIDKIYGEYHDIFIQKSFKHFMPYK
jgi:hypothetical protein